MACGFLPLSGPLTPPFTYTNWGITNPGTPLAFVTIDSNDHFGNGLFDDNTTATATNPTTGQVINFATCGSAAPSVSLVSRNRITLALPGTLTNCDWIIGIVDTWTGPNPAYYNCGNPSPPPPTIVTRATNELPEPASTGGSGCSASF